MSAVDALRSPWIVSKQTDLVWFLGSALAGFLLLLVALFAGGLPVQIFTFWWVVLDGPHVYSTTFRTVFDRAERAKHKDVWLALIPLCLIGPTFYLLGLQRVFFLLLMTWGQFHIAKQHVGFAMLYRAKVGMRNAASIEKRLILILLALPMVYYLGKLIGVNLLEFLLAATGVVFAIYVHSTGMNAQKLTLIVLNCGLWWASFLFAATDVNSEPKMLAAVAAMNVGHSLQYLQLGWFHNHNRYSTRTDLLGLVSRKWLFFFAAALLLAFPFRLMAHFSHMLALSVLGLLMLHYLLDARIWRVRKDPELAPALKL